MILNIGSEEIKSENQKGDASHKLCRHHLKKQIFNS